MPVNDIISDISPLGITINGTPFGGTRPDFGQIGEGAVDALLIHARRAIMVEAVSVLGNNSFISPVSFGLDKAILSINGDIYTPNKDYTVIGPRVKWLNPDVTIGTSDTVNLWGPANEYTAGGITFEYIDLLDELIYNNGAQTILITGGNTGGNNLPYDEKAIYLVIDGKVYRPGIDFTYSKITNKITWLFATPLTSSRKAFAFYFNNQPLEPYNLGEALIRTFVTPSNNQVNFPIAAVPKPSMKTAPLVFRNFSQKVINKDFKLEYPNMKWIGSPAMATSDKMDFSFLRDLNYTFSIFNNLQAGNNFLLAQDGKYEGTVTDLPAKESLGFLFFNGVLNIGTTYDAITMEGAQVFTPEYSLVGKKIRYDSDARLPEYIPVSSTEVTWAGFSDINSKTYSRVEYFRGWTGDVKTLGASCPDQTKVVVWINGKAYFQQEGSFSVSGTSLTLTPDDVVHNVNHDIVVWFHTDNSYASLWKFVPLTIPGTAWEVNETIVLSKPLRNVNNSFLFINGQHYHAGVSYSVDSTGYILKNLDIAGINGAEHALPAYVMLVYV